MKMDEYGAPQQQKILRYAELVFKARRQPLSDGERKEQEEILKELSLSHGEIIGLAGKKILN